MRFQINYVGKYRFYKNIYCFVILLMANIKSLDLSENTVFIGLKGLLNFLL